MIRALVFCILLAMLLVGMGVPELPEHPAQLPSLSVDDTFPRFTPEELASAGYPDHGHVYGYPGYEPRVADDGTTYGLFTLARGTKLLPREGLVVEPGQVRYRHVHLRHGPGLTSAGVMPVVEVFDWAEREVTDLLGHSRPDTLRLIDTADLDEYRELTGHEFHRLYHRDGSTVTIEPAKVLFARGLALHAAYHAVTLWQLEHLLGGQSLPHWFTEGLASYLSEDGCHFLSYLLMYRADGPVILPPHAAEATLAGAPDPDPERDKAQYRMAGYSAFLMMWELIEHRGGLRTLREFLHRVRDGEPAGAVSRELWGADLDDLAAELDPTTRPEPVGDAVEARQVHRPPSS